MSISVFIDIEKFGIIRFAEQNSPSARDFERSFKKYFSTKKHSPLRAEFLTHYGVKDGYLEENPTSKDFKSSFKDHFYAG